jgi:hypothetical protein
MHVTVLHHFTNEYGKRCYDHAPPVRRVDILALGYYNSVCEKKKKEKKDKIKKKQ